MKLAGVTSVCLFRAKKNRFLFVNCLLQLLNEIKVRENNSFCCSNICILSLVGNTVHIFISMFLSITTVKTNDANSHKPEYLSDIHNSFDHT